MIPDFKTYVGESVWGDIRRRGNGTTVKKEDDIELLDRDGMYDYILDHYQETKYLIQSKPFKSSDYISIPLFFYGNTIYPCYIKFRQDNGRPKEFTIGASIKICEQFIDKLKEFCLIDDNGGFGMVKVFPKEGNITNSFCLKVLDTILENVNNPTYEKKNLNESVWGDIRKRGNGSDEKKEDDIDLLDAKGLKDYLMSNYKPLNAYAVILHVMGALSVPIIRNQVNFSILYDPEAESISKITIANDFVNMVNGLLEKLKTNFSIVVHNTDTPTLYGITPKDGSEVTNKFFIEVIDFLLNNIEDSNNYKKAIKKINNKS